GRDFLRMAQPFIYDPPLDGRARQDVRNMKGKIDRKMTLRGQLSRNVKLGTGGIREIELIAQSLQVQHGGKVPQVQGRNTLSVLEALTRGSFIEQDDCDALTRGYIFLRDVENKLQMANDAQTHSLPRDEEELNVVARTLGYSNAEAFLRDYEYHTRNV